jgi:staphylococcal nuclease domain-containing protein 1
VLEGVDKFSNLIGSVYYPDGDSAKDLALELVETVCAYIVVLLLLIYMMI